MGLYLNPGNEGFKMAVNAKIYVDKSGLIDYANGVLLTPQRFICVSRPRRFGKSMAAEMLSAYYDCSCDSGELFHNLKIEKKGSFRKNLNQYDVVFLNMAEFKKDTFQRKSSELCRNLIEELLKKYPDLDYMNRGNLQMVFRTIFAETGRQFVFIIDEWDSIFREDKNDSEHQTQYLDFLRDLLKDRTYVALAYMTGILPIKKYGTHSALNMFSEFSMTNARELSEYVGFTEPEVKVLCSQYHMDFEEMKRWYDGYELEALHNIYNPKSVVEALTSGKFYSYWNTTETYEALREYILMNMDGLKDIVIDLLAGGRKKINTTKFSNDMTTFRSADDVLTLLVHLGYLAYDSATSEVLIPNSEVAGEFANVIEDSGWEEVAAALKQSDHLLKATLQENARVVAELIEKCHLETSILTYNDENSLACTLSLAYYSARTSYVSYRELPAGNGFADLVFIPRRKSPDVPALVVELKWNQSAHTAIDQIKRQKYLDGLKDYKGKVLLVGINYDKSTKKHECEIEESEIL